MQPRCFCSNLRDVLTISIGLTGFLLATDYFLFPIFPHVPQSRFRNSRVPSPERNSAAGEGSRPYRNASWLSNSAAEEGSRLYRNVSWKSNIGHWLSQCEFPTKSVVEAFPTNACENSCGDRGVCNHNLAECRCFHGYSGKGCGREIEYPCTIADDFWRVSSCGAICDQRKAFCYCGENTRYPKRPVAEACGFDSRDGVDWTVHDPIINSNNSEEGGWCNLDPGDMTRHPKPNCFCNYDGMGGPLCTTLMQSVCINQCSGNGNCQGGFCVCFEGWYGIDCSIPSPLSKLERWPTWMENNASISTLEQRPTLQLTIKRPRPLIYIYDLPPQFNNHLLEGRHFKYWCSTRTYDEQNSTIWIENLYGSESAVLESLLASSHRTTNAEEADYFYVPSFEACSRVQADSAPHTDMQRNYMGLRGYFAGDLHKQAYQHIKEAYPYWNRTDGKDHIWLFPWDEGACSAPKEIWNSIMLVHWGNTNSKYNYSTTAYHADNWDAIPREWRGNHPCYDPDKDLVLPAWKTPDPHMIQQKLWARPKEERSTLFYFNGNLGSMYESGRPEKEYSMQLRQRLAEEFGSLPNKKGELGRQMTPDVVVVSSKTPLYGNDLSRSRFCGVFPGDGWSGRMEDSILHGCIPVIVQDGIHLPYENVLDYNAFTVRIAEDDLPQLVQILRSINESRIHSMLAAVQGLWQRFTYHNAVKLEAQRQKLLGKHEEGWAIEYNKLLEDDTFATLIQVLKFKLFNSSWRTALNKGINTRDY